MIYKHHDADRRNCSCAGAGSGIGRAVAQRLACYGAKAVICTDLKMEAAKETVEICKGVPRPAELGSVETAAHWADVRDETSVDNWIDEIARTYGRIDVVTNTAGIGEANQAPIRDMSLADWRSPDEVHNIGCFLLTRAALHIMDKQLAAEPKSAFGDWPPIRGAIAMLTSLASEGAFPGVGNYVAAKHAVKGMVQTAAIENAFGGIRFNAVAPSYISGPMIGEIFAAAPEVKKALLGDLPMKRLVGPKEVADAVVFLASSASSYVNSHTLVVDGGALIPLPNSPFWRSIISDPILFLSLSVTRPRP